MLAIEFDNGDLLIGVFSGQHEPGNISSMYRISDAQSLSSSKSKIINIRLGDYEEKDNWWYPIEKIVKFKDVTEEEIKQLKRDGKLNELGL